MFVVDVREDLEHGTRNRSFAYIAHPKTGSQSMQKVLRETFDARVVKGVHDIDPTECEQIIQEGGIVACTVRNPWDLMVSWYHFARSTSDVGTFRDWLMRILTTGNGWIEKRFYGLEYCNRVFRFEYDLQLQLNNCLIDCGLRAVDLPHIGATEHRQYSYYYDSETAAAVALA
ncbi:MAG: hypothetical protein L0287_36645, partial [Anaerolineae bacterium]|nr:hypothetical protein [Anaerolineae bacterium]